VIADFGIARAVAESGDERLTRRGSPVGNTRLHESRADDGRARGPIDAATRVYALAAVLRELLARDIRRKGIQSVLGGLGRGVTRGPVRLQ